MGPTFINLSSCYNEEKKEELAKKYEFDVDIDAFFEDGCLCPKDGIYQGCPVHKINSSPR